MEVSKEEIENLKKIQDIDAEIKTYVASYEHHKEIDEYLAVRVKVKELEKKKSEVDSMKSDVEKRLNNLSSEEASLMKRQESVQKSIDEASGDFRNLEAHTKELDTISARMNTVSELLLKATEEQDKVAELETKLSVAYKQLNEKLQEHEAKVRVAKKSIAKNIQQLSVKREDLFSKLSADLALLYENAVSKVGNIVLATLDGDSCSVCRSRIEEGKLLEIQKSKGVSTCPACGRIIIIED